MNITYNRKELNKIFYMKKIMDSLDAMLGIPSKSLDELEADYKDIIEICDEGAI